MATTDGKLCVNRRARANLCIGRLPASMPKLGVVHWKKFEKFLLVSGCEFSREEGDHRIYWKKGVKRPIVIPRDTLPPFIMLNNLRTLGISRDEYLKIIRRL